MKPARASGPAHCSSPAAGVWVLAEMSESQLHSVGQIKRFLELWWSGDENRQALAENHADVTARYGSVPTLEEMRPFVDATRRPELHEPGLREDFATYLAFGAEKARHLDVVKKECIPSDPRFAAWRARQVARSRMENGARVDHSLPHIPLALEICRGCSVGCWYCGCDAGPLEKVFAHTPENARLYREVLEVFLGRIGDAARWASSYWATEPLDNPDYERFMDDFHDVCGMYPQTTTARADDDFARLRRLLHVSEEKGRFINRFSIQSLRQFDAVLREFDADELTRVEMVFQHPQAMQGKANAGRFFRHAQDNPKILDKEMAKLRRLQDERGGDPAADLLPAGTNSCMSGFWVNLVDRFVRLVSPTNGSERWPGGWILFGERSFTDAADLDVQIGELIETHMPASLPWRQAVSFAPGFDYEPTDRGFTVRTAHARFSFGQPDAARSVTPVGEMIRKGTMTPGDVALMASLQSGIPEVDTHSILSQCFEAGLLREEPEENAFEAGRLVAAREALSARTEAQPARG